jgi:hypothetical protein
VQKRANKASFKGKVNSRGDSLGLLFDPGDFVIVERESPRLVVMKCPCGCGDDLIINLDSRAGKAWRLYHRKESYTLSPSYWRESECQSHFIVWGNNIIWCTWDRDDEFDYSWEADEEMEKNVLNNLSKNEYIHYLEIADACDLISWECFQACKQLVRKGLAHSKGGSDYGYYKRTG